jgi:hypothetical protein
MEKIWIRDKHPGSATLAKSQRTGRWIGVPVRVPVEGVGRHGRIHVPYPDGVVTAAGHETARWQHRLPPIAQASRVDLRGYTIDNNK